MAMKKLGILGQKGGTGKTTTAAEADLVLIPCRPSPLDLDALEGMADLLRIANDPLAYVVLNGLPPVGRSAYDKASAIIERKYKLTVCPSSLCQRSIFSAAQINGQTAVEIEPEGKAAAEIRQLYAFVSETLNLNISISQSLNPSVSRAAS